MLLFHPTLSPSPVCKAFPHIKWKTCALGGSIIAVSKPEQSLLESADEHPLEYTLAEFDDAFAYARLLMKLLDQAVGPSSPGRVSQLALLPASVSTASSAEFIGFEVEEALQYLQDDKTGVMTHYLISQLYEMMGLLTERSSSLQQRLQRKSPTNHVRAVEMTTIFYQQGRLMEDWRPLLRLLYRPGDPFSQRGAALCLAYILQAGTTITSSDSFSTSSSKIPMVEETLQSLVSWLTSRLQSSHGLSLGVVTPTLVVLATCPTARIMFHNAGGVGYLSRHLRPKNSVTTASRRSSANTTSKRSRSSNGLHGSAPYSPSRHPAASGYTSNGFTTNPRSLSSYSNDVTTSNPHKGGRFASSYSNVSVQQLYELCFCLWTMTYDCCDDNASVHTGSKRSDASEKERLQQQFARDGAVPALVELLAVAPREKIARLAWASLRNLAQASTVILSELVAYRVLPMVERSLQELQGNRGGSGADPDLTEDLEVLYQILKDHYQEMTKWEVYQAELESGQLRWGALHTDTFFKANIRRMEGIHDDFSPVKRLTQLIGRAGPGWRTEYEDGETVAVACFDLGEFIRLYPNGKTIAKRFGAKEIVMPLMMDDEGHPEVQRQALQCISKLLVSNWKAVIGGES